ncbi:head-tail joining protein [Sphingobium chungbukense]|uniref:Uncharacterized protein n=1 Tax=Sphingobium chungbukense TaxID=56193 RepID=A0A0M3AQS3_9SPHN|nr:hypothetical protein [Sphingobium chungbukense]KKW92253.1 hypothetical protein YP76_09980 [Sphingobium chungbukense]
MSGPFAAALDALFNAPGSAAADYDDGLSVVPIRVILSQPDVLAGAGQQIVTATMVIDIRRSEVSNPARFATVRVGERDADGVLDVSASYQLVDEPMGDVEGLTWSCGAELIAP